MKVLLHPKTQASLAALAAHPVGSVILHGRKGMGKFTAALELVRIINCQSPGEVDPCVNCRLIGAGNFPDLIIVSRNDKPSVTIEQVRTLISGMALRPYRATSIRTVIIDDADTLTTEAQNALLKFLEEPPAQTFVILIAEQLETLLPTVRSRCQRVVFLSPPPGVLITYLQRQYKLDPSAAQALHKLSGGAPGTAIGFASDPTAYQAVLELAQGAKSLSTQPLFKRLVLAGQLANAKVDFVALGNMLHHNIVAALTRNETSPAQANVQLEAIELFRRHLAANVVPKAALERLVLELGP